MKKATAFLLCAAALTAILSGCGYMGMAGDVPSQTEIPAVSASPAVVTPDPGDGIVRDDDGIITDGDTGRGTGTRPNTGTAGTGTTGNNANNGAGGNTGTTGANGRTGGSGNTGTGGTNTNG